MTVPIGGTCDACGAPLGFLEGPECDACVTKPLHRPEDKYAAFPRGERDDDDEDPVSSGTRRPSTARDRFAVDLQTRAIVFPR